MKSCMNYAFPDDKMPAALEEKHPDVVASIKTKYPEFIKHIGEVYEELPGGEFMAGAGRSSTQDEVRFLTEVVDDFRRFVDEIWRF